MVRVDQRLVQIKHQDLEISWVIFFLEDFALPHLFPHHVESVSGDGGEGGDVILDGLVLLDLRTEKE